MLTPGQIAALKAESGSSAEGILQTRCGERGRVTSPQKGRLGFASGCNCAFCAYADCGAACGTKSQKSRDVVLQLLLAGG